MLAYITLLLGCQLAGEILARLSGLPVPGPVVGMVILFVGLVIRDRVPTGMERVSNSLLRYLSLLFVPAGVGVVAHLKRLSEALLPIAGAVVAGTMITIAVTGVIMQFMLQRGRKE